MPESTRSMEIPDATAQPQEYRAALLALIGDRDPMPILADTPDRVRDLFGDRDDEELAIPPAAGEWSAADVVGHLVDVEIVYGFRLRLTVTADQPEYPGYDEKRWSQLSKPPARRLLETFAALREYNLRMLRALPGAGWERVGVHGEQGPETVEIAVRKIAAHDLAHLDQVERALR